MSVNKLQAGAGPVQTLKAAMTHPISPVSGDPCRLGSITGVALVTKNAAGDTVADIGVSIFSLSVKGVDAGGNSPVAKGDALYYVDADTPVLSKKVAGIFFGYALETITTGSTATIRVLTGGKRG